MAKQKTSPLAAGPNATKSNDGEETRRNILDVATHEFADKGMAGARIDEIAERTQTSKRMIYYYFDSKEGLYKAVLERAYARIRELELAIEPETMPPIDALAALVRFTFQYHERNPEFVRLVMNENILHGAHIGTVEGIKARSRSVIAVLDMVLKRGVETGDFRAEIDPINLHMSISALCFYNVSNRHTFTRVFDYDMAAPASVASRQEIIVDMILRWCRA